MNQRRHRGRSRRRRRRRGRQRRSRSSPICTGSRLLKNTSSSGLPSGSCCLVNGEACSILVVLLLSELCFIAPCSGQHHLEVGLHCFHALQNTIQSLRPAKRTRHRKNDGHRISGQGDSDGQRGQALYRGKLAELCVAELIWLAAPKHHAFASQKSDFICGQSHVLHCFSFERFTPSAHDCDQKQLPQAMRFRPRIFEGAIEARRAHHL
mmetsp:Transcript_96956/g.175182  ORF Transcript_96956/g.175182 Transcript_96956/m.175182 type:complete len:209 (-) Transcript_96956:447-1073(-)